jgi:hypothetical protein
MEWLAPLEQVVTIESQVTAKTVKLTTELPLRPSWAGRRRG